MAHRKFFYGDMVTINHERYPMHTGHTGVIAGTRIKKNSDVTYSVDCECGMSLIPKASHMDLVASPSELSKVSSIGKSRIKYFLNKIGILPKESQLKKQVEVILGRLKDRDRMLLVKRFGLEGNAKTHREIGEEFGITRARVQHLEKALVERLRR
jgi:hypothetical protein